MSDSDWYYVKNWWKFQDYRFRRPPWIRLWKDVENDPTFLSLSELDQYRLIRLWLYAAEIEGRLPRDHRKIRARLCSYHGRSVDNLVSILISKGFISQQDIRGLIVEKAPTEISKDNTERSKKEEPSPSEKPPSLQRMLSDLAIQRFQEKYNSKPTWMTQDYIQLTRLLKARPAITMEEFDDRYQNFLTTQDSFHSQQNGSLKWFCTHYDVFIQPILRGDGNARFISKAEQLERGNKAAVAEALRRAKERDREAALRTGDCSRPGSES